MKESLLATVGHDLRAPLNAMRKQLETVQAGGRELSSLAEIERFRREALAS
jgi:K+-sensing histidine kinase KdpD